MCLALLLQIGVNLANDYFDGVRGIDSGERLGPVRVTQSGLIPSGHVRAAVGICLLLTALPGIYVIYLGGWPIVILAIASILSTLAYSGGPYPLASHGLGDVFVFIFFGLVAVSGTYYIQAGVYSWASIWAALPPGLLITAILVVNNLRDIPSDGKAGKKTLAVILGERATRGEYTLLLGGAYLAPVVYVVVGVFRPPILIPLLSIPLAAMLIIGLFRTGGRGLNKTLGDTARLTFLYCILFSMGLALL
jgi:1,4-dihydroxy-2-naphthoate octaprenyltransferase